MTRCLRTASSSAAEEIAVMGYEQLLEVFQTGGKITQRDLLEFTLLAKWLFGQLADSQETIRHYFNKRVCDEQAAKAA